MTTEYRVLYETTTGSVRVLLETTDPLAAHACIADFRELGKTVTLESRDVPEWEVCS